MMTEIKKWTVIMAAAVLLAGAGRNCPRVEASDEVLAGLQIIVEDVTVENTEPDIEPLVTDAGSNPESSEADAERNPESSAADAGSNPESSVTDAGSNPESSEADAERNPESSAADTGSTAELSVAESRVEEYLRGMTIEEKVAQMFVVLPEPFLNSGTVTAAGDVTRSAMDAVPVGGFVYMEQNIQSASQVTEMLAGVQEISMERIGLPAFTCVDEEGGTVLRVNGRGIVDAPYIGDMADIGQSGDAGMARQTGTEIGTYLSGLGFNVDFAPVADVLTNSENTVVRRRSFGSDPQLVSEMVLAELEGLRSAGVCGTLKHFPGHGATAGDTHDGYAAAWRTLDELTGCELVPFQAGIDAGAEFIMTGHISLPDIVDENTPASLSYTMTTEILREQMGYDGIVITDALNMGAIQQMYSSSEAAVKAVSAGADLLLMPADFDSAYYGVLDAVEQQVISQDRIDESLRRIIRVKLEIMDRMQ